MQDKNKTNEKNGANGKELIKTARKPKIPKPDTTMKPAEKKEQYRFLMELKKEVRDMERHNFNQIIVFASTNGWFKIAFMSNLIYHLYVEPFLEDVKFKNRPDSDRYYVSKTGFTPVSDIIVLAEELKKRGATIPEELDKYLQEGVPESARPKPEELDKMYVFEFKRLTQADMDKFIETHEKDRAKLNELAMRFYIPQNLYRDLHMLAEQTLNTVTHLPAEVRGVVGKNLMDSVLDILSTLNLACNGYSGEQGFRNALKNVVAKLAILQEAVLLMLDCGCIKYGQADVILTLALNCKQDSVEETKKLSKDGDPVTKAIKRMKNMPKDPSFDMSDKLPGQTPGRQGNIRTRTPMMPEGE